MSSFSSFIKSSGFYFLGNVLSKLIVFFLLPVYTSNIATSDLGYYDVANTVLTLVTTFLFVDIYVGIMRFIFDVKDKSADEVLVPIFNGFLIFSGSLAIYTLIAVLLYFFGDINYLGYIYCYGVCIVFNNLFGYIARAQGLNKLFALSGVISTLITSVLNIVGLVFLKWGIEALYISSILGLSAQVLILELRLKLLKHISFKYYKKELLVELFKYSIPLSLNSLAFWLLTGYTNVAISHILGLEANGIYNVAIKFGVVITLLSTCFNLAWQELIFKRGNETKEKLGFFYSKAVNMLLLFFGIGATLLTHFTFLIFPFMVKGDYREALNIIPLYIIVAVIGVISSFLGQIYAAIKETRMIMYSTLTACVFNVILVPVFISFFQLPGAIMGMALSYLINVGMRIWILRRRIRIELNGGNCVMIFILLMISFIVFYTKNIYCNFVFLIIVALFGMFLFRGYIRQIIRVLRGSEK